MCNEINRDECKATGEKHTKNGCKLNVFILEEIAMNSLTVGGADGRPLQEAN